MTNMSPRSFLFVPADSERKMAKAASTAADAIVLDLEDSVSVERIEFARNLTREFLLARSEHSKQQVWVRINPLDSGKALDDLAAIVGASPDGLLLPKCESGAEVTRLDHYLTALERREGIADGAIRIIPVATETPAAMFQLGSYQGASRRLHGITWGAEDLSTALGASTNKADDSTLGFTYQLARTYCLLGAKAAGVQAIDGIYANFRDSEALASEVRRSRRDGFNAKFAIHPDQVAVINAGFLPDERDVERARAIVAAFNASNGVGTTQLDGMMLDKPHLTQALQILEAVGLTPGKQDHE
jgi:citrate lyase subunit beta/citryl-CoA lyase